MKQLLFLLIVTFIFVQPTYAIDMNSDHYRIQFGNVNIGGVNSQESGDNHYKLGVTVGQTSANQFADGTYIVKAGFQYIHSIIPFSFSVSNINLNLGTLIPNTFSTATTNLTVSFGSAGVYQVTAIAEHPLKTIAGSTIPFTQCDVGDPCTSINVAKPWTNTSRYGFGYNMSGTDIPADFIGSTYYRPFADRSNGDNPITVMTSTNVGRSKVSTMTVKTNISAIQPEGNYETIINFVATPSY